MNLQKLTLNHILILVGVFLAFGLVAFLGRLSLEAIQKSQIIDQSLAMSSAPALNLSSLKKAKEVITNMTSTGALTPSPSSPSPSVSPTSTPTVDSKVSQSDLLSQIQQVEIINTTGVEGAAQQAATIFVDTPNITFDLKNGESDIDETTIVYKNKYKELVATWQTALKGLDWNVGKLETKAESDTYDVTIILAN